MTELEEAVEAANRIIGDTAGPFPNEDPDGVKAMLARQFLRALGREQALAQFKSWVHAYLDSKGIPADPGGPHSKEGCRIGDRMDLVFSMIPKENLP